MLDLEDEEKEGERRVDEEGPHPTSTTAAAVQRQQQGLGSGGSRGARGELRPLDLDGDEEAEDQTETCRAIVPGAGTALAVLRKSEEAPEASSSSSSSALALKSCSTLSVRATAGGSCLAVRQAAGGLLERSLSAAGASQTEAAAWGRQLELAAWAVSQGPAAGLEDEDEASGAARATLTSRRFRAEARRLTSALKDREVADGLLSRIRAGELQARQLVALPPEALLPAAKRARLAEEREQGLKETLFRRQDLMKDEEMQCEECHKVGGVRWMYMSTVKDGFTKAETWGSSGNSDRSERCRAQCDFCFAEWQWDA